jgi:hypothetical protein
MARRSFPDLTSSFGLNEKDAFGSTTSDDERDRERLAWDASATERARTGSDAEASATTALDSLARGGLLRLFESTFHLRAKGLVRRTIVAAARQTLEFFVGAAVEDLACRQAAFDALARDGEESRGPRRTNAVARRCVVSKTRNRMRRKPRGCLCETRG